MTIIMDFFTELFHGGASHSALASAKAALATFVKVDNSDEWKNDPVLNRFMRGCYKSRVPLPRHSGTWDVEVVLKFLDNFEPIEEVTFKELTLKAVALVALASGSRCQTIHLMDLDFMTMNDDSIQFWFDVPLKTSKPGHKSHTLEFQRFTTSTRCVLSTLREYIRRTESIRKSRKLWIKVVKPHNEVTKETIGRWLKKVLVKADIDKKFTAHSFRMASTSKAAANGLGLESILQTANWSSATNFHKFYLREVKPSSTKDSKISFAKAVLTNQKE